ncbi:hypothetical protein [Dactylosporangium sp. NPDC005555]|uniref:hypothetical protein n=1 Tax=Dactylosporangium sp. NPDC005555 TaxID=3154889 RepID=UPI0033A9CDA5
MVTALSLFGAAIWLPAEWHRQDAEADAGTGAGTRHGAQDAPALPASPALPAAPEVPASPEHDRPERCLTATEQAAWLSLTASLKADQEQ